MSSQVAIVTGGSKGIGLAIARALLDRDMQVVISARKQDELDAAQQQLGGSSRVHAVRGDVGVPATPSGSSTPPSSASAASTSW